MITVKNLHFTYPKATTEAVKGINFEVESGEILGFLGPSGAGKSTTQKILIGLLKGYQGQISVMGKEVREWGSDYYERVGVGFELPNHYLKLTALENLNYFRALYQGNTADPHTLLEMVGLGKEGETFVSQFSKGMKMRLNFVRALLNQPKLMFLDEPVSGLDPVNAQIIKDIIRQKQAEGTTIFVTTHNMTVADQLCDRVAFIIDGEIKLIDSPKTLKLQYGEPKVKVEFGLNGHAESREFALHRLGYNHEFLQAIQRDDVQTIHTQETTLEKIFIEVTGQELA